MVAAMSMQKSWGLPLLSTKTEKQMSSSCDWEGLVGAIGFEPTTPCAQDGFRGLLESW